MTGGSGLRGPIDNRLRGSASPLEAAEAAVAKAGIKSPSSITAETLRGRAQQCRPILHCSHCHCVHILSIFTAITVIIG